MGKRSAKEHTARLIQLFAAAVRSILHQFRDFDPRAIIAPIPGVQATDTSPKRDHSSYYLINKRLDPLGPFESLK